MIEIHFETGIDHNELELDQDRLVRHAGLVLAENGIEAAEVSVVFVGDETMTRLNEDYRKRSGTTDVLSFLLSPEDAEILEGEVYVSLAQARSQAHDYGVSHAEETLRLVTHCLLHLCGLTHGTEADLATMTELTESLVRRWFDASVTEQS